MKCAECLKIRNQNPHISLRELFPRGEVEDAVTVINGTALCNNCAKSTNLNN